MNTQININQKTLDTDVIFKVEDIQSQDHAKECLIILTMIAGDYALDPEIELEDFNSFVEKAKSEDKMALLFSINEDGLELEFINI